MKDFIYFLRAKEQRRELALFSGLFLILGVTMHLLYPYPFSFSDSGSYLLGASRDFYNAYRPQGYSQYLQLLHSFSTHLSFVYFATFFLTAAASLFLLFTAKYLFNLRNKILFYTLSLFAILNPCILFSCNFLMSDGLFNLLTILFVTTALWLIFSENKLLIIIHLGIFILLYKVRYSGMFYLPVTVFAFILSSATRTKVQKIILILLPFLCFAFLYTSQKREYHRQTGVNISSAFSGWQLLNNASVLFPEAKEIPVNDFDSPNLKVLHAFMQNFPDSLYSPEHAMKTNYMWWKELPGKQFLFYYLQQSKQDYQSGWVYMGSLYQEYAKTLILHYPWQYFRKFIVPSFLGMFKFQPFIEESAPLSLDQYAAEYYGLNTTPYPQEHQIFQSLNPVRKVFNVIYWLLLFSATLYFFICLFRKKYFRERKWQAALLLIAFILIYIGISCLASPNTTWRYTMPIFIPSLIFIACMANQMIENGKIHGKLLFPHKK